MKIRIIPATLFFALIICTGCVSATSNHTSFISPDRPAISAHSVRIIDFAPTNSELIARVSADCENFGKSSREKCSAKIKQEAALIGANVVVLDNLENQEFKEKDIFGSIMLWPIPVYSKTTHFTGKAYFSP